MAGKVIIFILPFDKTIASNFVRAKCLEGYDTYGWKFIFLQGEYPKLLNIKFIRAFYRLYFNLINLFKIKKKYNEVIALTIKQDSLILIFLIRKILNIKVIFDLNDPLHLFTYVGEEKCIKLINFVDYTIFESPEYRDFLKNKYSVKSIVIEDTPQFEYIFTNYSVREKVVVWVGSPVTSNILLEFIPHILELNRNGYKIKLIGASIQVNKTLLNAGISTILIEKYDHNKMVEILSTAKLAFVPMFNENLYLLRGNLKAKISMACGCLVIASNNKMHKRIIRDGENGFLFDSYDEFYNILKDKLTNTLEVDKIAFNGNKYVSENFTRTNQAFAISRVADEIKFEE